ncbi:MAG: hypothetical protein R3B48_16330 [Kofleriaceae bacterium]
MSADREARARRAPASPAKRARSARAASASPSPKTDEAAAPRARARRGPAAKRVATAAPPPSPRGDAAPPVSAAPGVRAPDRHDSRRAEERDAVHALAAPSRRDVLHEERAGLGAWAPAYVGRMA